MHNDKETMKKKTHCYYIPEHGYDSLNDHEGRWKRNDGQGEVIFEKFYPEDNYSKPKENEFDIEADFESGGWSVYGNIELFEEWVEDYHNGDTDCIKERT